MVVSHRFEVNFLSEVFQLSNTSTSAKQYTPNRSDYVVYYGALAAGCLVSTLNFDQGFVTSMGMGLLGSGMGWVLLTLGLLLIGQPPNVFFRRYLDRIKALRK